MSFGRDSNDDNDECDVGGKISYRAYYRGKTKQFKKCLHKMSFLLKNSFFTLHLCSNNVSVTN